MLRGGRSGVNGNGSRAAALGDRTVRTVELSRGRLFRKVARFVRFADCLARVVMDTRNIKLNDESTDIGGGGEINIFVHKQTVTMRSE